MAYGALEIKPWELPFMTPAEINDMIDGYDWRLNRQLEREAKWVAALINGMGKYKNAVRPERLLGRPLGPQYDKPARGTPSKK